MKSNQLVEYHDTTPKPTPAAPAAVEPEKTLSADELQAAQDKINENMWGKRVKSTDLSAPPAPPALAEPAPAPAAPAAAPVVPPPAPAPVQIQPSMSDDGITRAATIAAQTVLDAQKTAPAAPVAPPFEMSDEDAEDYKVVQFLERTDAAKYAGRAQSFLDYVKAHYAYQDEWSSKNDGKEFDANDSDHEAWYAKHVCPITDAELKKGAKAMERAEIRDEIRREEIEPLEMQRRAEKATEIALPMVMESAGRSVIKLIQAINPDLAAIVTGPQGQLVLSPDAITKFEETDAIAYEEIQRILKKEEDLWAMLIALEFTAVPDAGRPLNPGTNALHARIGMHVERAEQAKLKDPQRNANGKEFVRIQQYQQMISDIQKSNYADKEQRIAGLDAKYYTLNLDDVINHVINYFSQMAKANIEKMDKLAQKKYRPANGGGQPNAPAPAAPQPAAPAPTAPPAGQPRSSKPNSPSLASTGDTGQPADRQNQPAKTVGEQIVETMYRK